MEQGLDIQGGRRLIMQELPPSRTATSRLFAAVSTRSTEMTRVEILSRIESLKQQLVAKYAPEKIILFGSAIRDDVEVNDVDLFIVKDDVPYLGADRIRQLYRLMDTDLPVDYLVYRPAEVAERLSLGDPFIMGVMREGRVLYG
jgi:predicted nucleotidyltransferase